MLAWVVRDSSIRLLVLNGDIVVDQSKSLTEAAFDKASQPSLTLAGVVVRN